MSSSTKWRASFQKARTHSQDSSRQKSLQRKTSLLEDSDLSVSDDELKEYLGTLKQKSGVGRLWTGNTFDKVIDRTPDVSISSVSDGEGPASGQDKPTEGDDDFLPNVMALPSLQATDDQSAVSEPSSIEPLEAINMISDLELSERPLELANNVKLTTNEKDKDFPEVKDIKSINNDLSRGEEPHTLDEVSEEIEEDLRTDNSGGATSSISLKLSDPGSCSSPRQKTGSSRQSSHHRKGHSSHHRKGHSSRHSSRQSSYHHHSNSLSKPSSTHPSSRRSSRSGVRSDKSDYSYSTQFSDSSKENTEDSFSKSRSATPSSAKTKSLRKRSSKHRDNQSHHDIAIQVNMGDLSRQQKLGAGRATVGPSFGNQYVDPTPIAPHVVSADALEAVTAYNPAIVALTDMLRQQLRLVEQFVDSSRRMYESYTSNLNNTYQYTTLEDTMKYIEQNEAKYKGRRRKRYDKVEKSED